MSSPFSPVRYLTKVGSAGFCEKLLWPVAKQSCLSSSASGEVLLSNCIVFSKEKTVWSGSRKAFCASK